MSKNPNIEKYLKNDIIGDPYIMNEGDTIWWLDINRLGPRPFSFDLKEVFDFWADYPDSLSPEQKEIFDQ